jgi:hypothetical protein
MNGRRPQTAQALTDFGMVGKHHLQGSAFTLMLLVDGVQVIACTPAEYCVAEVLLRSPGVPVAFDRFPLARAALSHVVGRVRRKLAPLDLNIRCELRYGYVLQQSEESAPVSTSGTERKKEGT